MEIGPRLTDEPLTREEFFRALRWFRLKNISFSELCRQAGYQVTYLGVAERSGKVAEPALRKFAWVFRALLDGNLVAVWRTTRLPTRRRQVFVAAGSKEALPQSMGRIARCVCGRYQDCPCGLADPRKTRGDICQRLLSAAAMPNAVASLTRLGRNPVARNVAPPKSSGFR